MSASDEEERQYNEEEEDEEYEDEEEEEDDEFEEDAEYSGVRVAKNDEEDDDEDEEEDEDDGAEDEEYENQAEEDEFSIMSNRASELVSQGQTDNAIQVLKNLTQGLANNLGDISNFSEEKLDDFRNKILGTLALWIEILRDGKIKSSDLADKLSSWQTAFVEDSTLRLLSTESDDEDEEEDDDKAIVKEFSELVDDLKQPSKKKQRS